MKNYRKATWTGRLDHDMSGRTGVDSYVGHAGTSTVGIHVTLAQEPDRPVAVLIAASEINDVIRLLRKGRKLNRRAVRKASR